MNTILIVDDFKTQRSFTKMFLGKMNCDVLEATNGKEAIEILQQQSVDAVITDMEMPVMDGIEMTKKIRNEMGKTKLPIIMITSNMDTQMQAKQAGVTNWLSKPYNEDDLRKILQKYLDGIEDNRVDYNVLLVDDAQMQTRIWEKVLTMEGFNFIHASSAREGLKQLRTHDIDMIITDYLMPEIDGLRFVKKVKSLDEFKQIPIFIVSEDDEVQSADKLPEVLHTFKKPFNPVQLKNLMRQHIVHA